MTRSESLAAALAPVNCRYGAPMGRREERPDDCETLWVSRVPFVDGCYDRGGAYWGGPANLYVVHGDQGARLYYRAASRADAIRQCLGDYPDAALRFARGPGRTP